jgi:hypothetical protein
MASHQSCEHNQGIFFHHKQKFQSDTCGKNLQNTFLQHSQDNKSHGCHIFEDKRTPREKAPKANVETHSWDLQAQAKNFQVVKFFCFGLLCWVWKNWREKHCTCSVLTTARFVPRFVHNLEHRAQPTFNKNWFFWNSKFNRASGGSCKMNPKFSLISCFCTRNYITGPKNCPYINFENYFLGG